MGIKLNNMTPKEKAQELVDKFNLPSELITAERKQCALIAVDEILNFMLVDDLANNDCYWANHHQQVYWQSVKTEIKKL